MTASNHPSSWITDSLLQAYLEGAPTGAGRPVPLQGVGEDQDGSEADQEVARTFLAQRLDQILTRLAYNRAAQGQDQLPLTRKRDDEDGEELTARLTQRLRRELGLDRADHFCDELLVALRQQPPRGAWGEIVLDQGRATLRVKSELLQ